MSIEAMEQEISNQAEDLPRFASQLRDTPLPKPKPTSLIFAGSGDSYAAALFAQELSKGQAVASDPYELLTNIGRTGGKTLVIISVSGRTRTNVELARKAKGIAARRLAITAHPESPLARECDETLYLEYRSTGILTSGTTSFTTSLLACAFLLGNLPRTIQLNTTLSNTSETRTRLKQAGKGAFVFTGSGINYTLAIYGVAKINEVLGAKAEAVYPEQLGHAMLFSMDEDRDLIICLSKDADKARRLHELLRKNNFHSSILSFPDSNIVQRSLKMAIYLQQLPLAIARRKKMTECAFLEDAQRLKLSSKMIY